MHFMSTKVKLTNQFSEHCKAYKEIYENTLLNIIIDLQYKDEVVMKLSVSTYSAVQPQGKQHDEEDDGPAHRARQGGNGLRVHHKHQPRTCTPIISK